MFGVFAKPVAFVFPLALDVLSVSAVLGALGLTGWARWRVSLVLATCQVGAICSPGRGSAHDSTIQPAGSPPSDWS